MLEFFYNKCGNLKIHKNIYIGYSGGLDSSVLLNLCFKIFKKELYKLKVININYSHNKSSKDWFFFCKEQCQKYNIPIITYFIDSSIYKKNLEQEFRTIRYKSFVKTISTNSSLLLAHNFSDLTETFFLNLFRGCGTNGMLSIMSKIKHKNLTILRPLLDFSKNELLVYAINNKVDYIIDTSNFDKTFRRNFLRYDVFTLIKSKYYNFENQIKKCINILNDNKVHLDFRYKEIYTNKKNKNSFLNILYLKEMPSFLRHEIIRLWGKNNFYKMLSYIHLKELDKLIFSKNSKNQFIKIGKFFIRKNINNLHIIKCDAKTYKFKDISKVKIFNELIKLNSLNKLMIIYANFFKLNYIHVLKKNLYPIIKYKNFIFIISGIWVSSFYKFFFKKKIIIRFLI